MDDQTTLHDLLQLELHRYEDEVRSIVDKAVKEMGMEKVLNELHTTWAQMEFDHEEHERTVSDAAAQELRHVLDRLGSRGEPVLVIARADQKFPRRLDTSAYGVPETGDTVFSRVVPSMPGSRRVVILEAPP